MGVVVVEVSARDGVPRGGVGRRRAVRTLPIRVQPLPEESLDSWLEALASRSDATWGEIVGALDFFGVRGNSASFWATRANVSLTPGQVDTISHCTGVDPCRLQSMTLQPWIKDTSWQRPSVASLRVSGSRFCPRCLEERGGRWRVWWRLRCGFVCPTHGCLLSDACGVCGGLQRTAPPRFNEVPKLGSCTRGVSRTGETPRCHEPLSSAPATCLDTCTAVVIQRELLCVLRAGYASGGIYGSSPVPSTVFMRDLRTLGTWMLRCAHACDVAARISDLLWEQLEIRARRRFAQPLITAGGARMMCSSAAIDATITCLAMPVLQADDTDIAAQRLQWLTTSMRRRGFSSTDERRYWSGGNSSSLNAVRRTVLSSRSSAST
ncbi:TniQ family protein [Mycobacterium avium]